MESTQEEHEILHVYTPEEPNLPPQEIKEEPASSFWMVFTDLVETLVVAVLIFAVVYLFLLQPNRIVGVSMLPNFHDSEYILTDKISYKLGQPKRGDVVIFKAPQSFKQEFIKRIIALPNEKIKLSNGEIFIYNDINPKGIKLNEPYERTAPTSPGPTLRDGDIHTLKDNEYFVMGDNRTQSFDSREWGTVPKDNIIGRSWLRYWPLNKLNFIPGVNYGF